MEKKEKAPVLRFKDTNGKDYPAWEQRKLTDLVSFYGGLTYKPTDVKSKGVLVLRSSNVKDGALIDADNVYVDPDVATSEKVKVGDIVMVVRNGSKALIGKHAEVKQPMADTVVGAFMAGIRSPCPSFANALLNTSEFDKEIAKNMGATINQLTGYMFKQMVFFMPGKEEQEKIGSLFSTLENTITLHQRKLGALKKLKRTLLQKMFPKKGQLNPELRFPGFTNDWEQRKLNEIASIYDGTHQTPRYTSNGIPFLSVENITTLQSSKFISEKDFLRDFSVYPQKGDVLLTRIGDVGTANVYERNQKVAFYVSLALLKLRETDPYFVNASFRSNSTRKEVWKRTLHIAFPKKINKNEIGKVNIQIPSLAEQRKIGIFFYSLDRLITLHQRKLEIYKKLKKGLLQKMFI